MSPHVARIGHRVATLPKAAGTGTVAGNLTEAVTTLFGPVALALIRLVIARDELRLRRRALMIQGQADRVSSGIQTHKSDRR